jgi:tetratricopeptide (TPR) repeat protein
MKINLGRIAALSLLTLVACKKEPNPAEIHLTKANDLFRAQSYAEAGAEYDQALQLDPKQDLKIWEKAAFSYMKGGNADKAADILMKTTEIKKDAEYKLETLKNIAGIYHQAGNLEKADHWFSEVMKLDPKDEQSLGWLAEFSSIRGGARNNVGPVKPEHLEKAVERYDQLIALNPTAPGPYINKRIALGRLIGALGEQKNAPGLSADDAQKLQARIDGFKTALEATNKQLGEVNKAARAGK